MDFPIIRIDELHLSNGEILKDVVELGRFDECNLDELSGYRSCGGYSSIYFTNYGDASQVSVINTSKIEYRKTSFENIAKAKHFKAFFQSLAKVSENGLANYGDEIEFIQENIQKIKDGTILENY